MLAVPQHIDLLAVLVHGLATAGAALIAKALTPRRWRAVKPFSCALCMSVWSGLLVVVADGVQTDWSAVDGVVPMGLRYLGAVAVSVWLIGQTSLYLPPLVLPPSE